jgi:hypothetical protein
MRRCTHSRNYAETGKQGSRWQNVCENVEHTFGIVKCMASNLLSQIADRTAAFLRHSEISQSRLCRHLQIRDSSLSQFLSGARGLQPETIIKLCQTLSLSHNDIATKFSAPVRSSKVLHLQESTQGNPARMRLDANDGAWVPGLSGEDPDGSTDITNTADASTEGGPAWDQDLIDTLRTTRGFHRQAIKAINNSINRAKAANGIVTPTSVAQKFSRRR